jgi:hypothetical protein
MVQVDPNPVGHFDAVSADVGVIRAVGWVIDPDAGRPADVDVFVDGALAARVRADLDRPDVAAAFPHLGGRFGFSVEVPAGPGFHNVCVVARNTGGGSDVDLGCRPVVVPANPVGVVEAVTSTGPGQLRVVGWARDADAAGPIAVRVLVDGVVVQQVAAAGSRPDPYNGSGFDVTLSGVAPGTRSVCVDAVNVGGGADVRLGCATTVAASTVVGQVQALRAVDGGVQHKHVGLAMPRRTYSNRRIPSAARAGRIGSGRSGSAS